MPKGVPISKELKQNVVNAFMEGKKQAAISKEFLIPRYSVSKIISCFIERGHLENLPKSGRPRKTTIWTDRDIKRISQNYPWRSASGIIAEIPEIMVSPRTVQRRYSELFSEQKRALVKIENDELANECEKLHEVTLEHPKIKVEEVDIKEEDMNISEIRYEKETVPDYISLENTIIKAESLEENVQNWSDNPEKETLEKSMRTKGNASLPNFIEENPVHNSHQKDCGENNKARLLKCDKCDYQAPGKPSFYRHLLLHRTSEEIRWFKCSYCSFKAIQEVQLQNHLKRHKDIEKGDILFNCDKCAYQTIRRSDLSRHYLRHMNADEVPVFKCHHCNYQALYKGYLRSHILKHRREKYNCDQCDFQTFRKEGLKRHFIIHKNPEATNTFKCNQCDFVTLHRKSMVKHMLGHECFKDVDKFKCNQCNYESIWRSNLTAHLVIHKSPDEIEMFKCNQCDFQTKSKSYIKKHIVLHNKSS